VRKGELPADTTALVPVNSRMKLRTIILSGFILPLAGPALGQVPDECKAKYGPIDLCATARTISDRLAPALPMRVSSEMTITTIKAAGNRVIMTATWELTEAQYREQLTTRHITPEQFDAHMERFTQRMVCAQKAPSAFVTLGGEIQYSYMSVDGHPIVAPVIDNCR
jgi:hypothetical protein